MVAKTKLNDDYVGALLRVQGVPNDVVNSLLKTNYCNVDGLRLLLGQSQAKSAKKVGINVDLLDGLPHRIREVFTKMDLKSSAEELEKMNDACQTWGPERPRVKEEEPVMGGDLEVAETDELQDNSDGMYYSDVPYGVDVLEGLFYSTLKVLPFLDAETYRDTSQGGLLREADTAMEEIENRPELLCLSILLKRIVGTFESFRCNDVPARLFRVKALETMILLGAPGTGLIDTVTRLNVPIEAKSLCSLEHLLSKYNKFFLRYTTENFLQATLVGKEPKDKFEQFHTSLRKLTSSLLDEYKVPDKLKLKPLESFDVAFDVKKNVDAAQSSPAAFARLAKEYGMSTSSEIAELRKEMQCVSESLEIIEAHFTRSITNVPQMIFRYTELTDFWLYSFGSKQIVTVEVFCSALSDHLCDLVDPSDKEGIKEIVATVNELKEGLVNKDNRNRSAEDALSSLSMLLDCRNIANLFRGVPRTNDLYLCLPLIITAIKDNCRCLLPPPPSDEVVWESLLVKQSLTEALGFTNGWVKVTGPSQSGKSSRVLTVCHNLLMDSQGKDFVWINMSGVGSDMEAVSRAVQQLGLRQVCSKADFAVVLDKFLSSLQPGSIVVFDNIEEIVKPPLSVSTLDIFYSVFLESCAKYSTKLCLVVVLTSPHSSSPVMLSKMDTIETFNESEASFEKVQKDTSSQRIFYEKEVTIGPLPLTVAQQLANILFPEDVDSFLKASRRLPGKMAYLAKYCDLELVRKIAAAVKPLEDDKSVVRDLIAKEIANSLTSDEKICASSLLRNMPSFDISLAWAFGKEIFAQDKVKWKVAWDGLVDKGWVMYDTELGYEIPVESVITGSISVEIKEQKQWECYISHWCTEVVRINASATESQCALQYFDSNRRHINMLFAVFYSPAVSPPTPFGDRKNKGESDLKSAARKDSEVKKDIIGKKDSTSAYALLSVKRGVSDLNFIALTLAGNIENILKSKYSLTGGTAIAKSIFSEIAKKQGPADFKYLVAAVDHAMLLKRMIRIKAEMIDASDTSSEAKRCNAALNKEMKTATLDCAKNLQLGLENHYVPGRAGQQSRGEGGKEKAIVLAKGLALLGLFLEDLGLGRSRKEDIARALSEAVNIWQGVGEDPQTNNLYQEVMAKSLKAANTTSWLRLRSKDKKDTENTVSKNGNASKSNNSTDENDEDFYGELIEDQDVSLSKKRGCCLM